MSASERVCTLGTPGMTLASTPFDRRLKVSTPTDRKHNITFEESPIDGRLPPIPGWPEHPLLAPQTRPSPRCKARIGRALAGHVITLETYRASSSLVTQVNCEGACVNWRDHQRISQRGSHHMHIWILVVSRVYSEALCAVCRFL